MNTPTLEELEEDVRYAFSCFDAYLARFPRERIRQAHICEIGPGKNLAVCLIFKSLGAEKVYAVDKYLKPWVEEYHVPFYRLLAEAVLSRWPNADTSALDACVERGEHAAIGLLALAEDAETLTGIPDASIDLLCSWASLEHLYDPPTAFARFAAVTKPEGIGLHQVDFRDHHDFTNPLEFLLHHYRWNEEPNAGTYAWLAQRLGHSVEQARLESPNANRSIRRVCGYNGNSYRHTDYNVLWQNNGFDIVQFQPNMNATDDYLDNFLPRLAEAATQCLALTREELGVISGWYEVWKKHDQGQ